MTYCCFCHIAGFPKDCFGNQSTGISHQIIPSLKSLNLRTISFIALTIFNELIILNAQHSCQQFLKIFYHTYIENPHWTVPDSCQQLLEKSFIIHILKICIRWCWIMSTAFKKIFSHTCSVNPHCFTIFGNGTP